MIELISLEENRNNFISLITKLYDCGEIQYKIHHCSIAEYFVSQLDQSIDSYYSFIRNYRSLSAINSHFVYVSGRMQIYNREVEATDKLGLPLICLQNIKLFYNQVWRLV